MPPAASLATSLKRGEGEPLSRHDIQYALLEKIFDDKHAVFTARPGSDYAKAGNKITFGDLYVDDVLASNKLSKTLKDKFLNDMATTRKVCMASVLVNTGRINTTLVFTHTQARTYNPIPAIQAYGAGHKLLQDAPRLKGILKGSAETGPADWSALRQAQKDNAPKPLVSPVTLIFLLTHTSTVMDIQHFHDPHFLPHELLSDYHYSSDSRARAFLWLMYFYIETNGTEEEQSNNPFGSGGEYGRVPPLMPARETDSLAENIDLPAEVEYATRMAEKRRRYLATTAAQKVGESTPRAKETPTPSVAGDTPVPQETSAPTPSQSELDSVRRSSRKVKKRTYESLEGDDFGDSVVVEQENYRTLRAAQILRHRMRRSLHASKKARLQQTAIQRAFAMDVEDDRLVFDDDDGEEALALAKVLRRAQRRIDRPRKRSVSAHNSEERRPDTTGSAKKSGGGFKIKLKF